MDLDLTRCENDPTLAPIADRMALAAQLDLGLPMVLLLAALERIEWQAGSVEAAVIQSLGRVTAEWHQAEYGEHVAL